MGKRITGNRTEKMAAMNRPMTAKAMLQNWTKGSSGIFTRIKANSISETSCPFRVYPDKLLCLQTINQGCPWLGAGTGCEGSAALLSLASMPAPGYRKGAGTRKESNDERASGF
jgi:hypothetical protein